MNKTRWISFVRQRLKSSLVRHRLTSTLENSDWNNFVGAASKISFDRVDYGRHSILPSFQAVLGLNDLKNRFKKLLNQERGIYILNVVVNLYLSLGFDEEAFEVLKLMFPKIKIGHNLELYPTNDALPVSIGSWHVQTLQRLSECPSLMERFDFHLNRLDISALAKESPELLSLKFENLLALPNLPQDQLLLAFEHIMRIYGFLHYNPTKVEQQLNKRVTEYGLPLTASDYLLLMEINSHLRRFDVVIEYYNRIDTTNERIREGALYYAIRAYFSLGYAAKALELLGNGQTTIITTSIWKAILRGFSKYEVALKDLQQVLRIYNNLVQMGTKPDQEIFHLVMNSYAKRKMYDGVLEWFDKMKTAGFEPDAYTFSILDGCLCHLSVYGGMNYDVDLFSRFTDCVAPLKHLESSVSLAQRMLIMIRRNDPAYISYTDIMDKLQSHPELSNHPELFAGILSRLIKSSPENVESFILYIRETGVPLTAHIYSLLILHCRQQGQPSNQAWVYYQNMIEEGIKPVEPVYRNLAAICFKTNDIRRCRILLDEILYNRSAPITPALYRDLILILTSDRKDTLNYERAAESRVIDPRIGVQSQVKHDFNQPVYVRMALELFKSRISNTSLNITTLPLARSLIQSATIHPLSFKTLKKIHKIILEFSDNPAYGELYAIFSDVLIRSNDWRTTFYFLKEELKSSESTAFQQLCNYISDLGQIKNDLALYTAFIHLYPITNDGKLISLILEQTGIYCRSLQMAKLIWEHLKYSDLDEEIIWTYVRSLVWCGSYEEAVEVATVGFIPKEGYSGKVVIELRKYLGLNGMVELESRLVDYWETKRPDWILQ